METSFPLASFLTKQDLSSSIQIAEPLAFVDRISKFTPSIVMNTLEPL